MFMTTNLSLISADLKGKRLALGDPAAKEIIEGGDLARMAAD
jgi:hypothetical protein